jgi:hypothetical protein
MTWQHDTMRASTGASAGTAAHERVGLPGVVLHDLRSILHRIDPWIAAALLFALTVRLLNLDAAALWLDETETAIWSTLTYDQVWRTVVERVALGRYDPRHLPLYFLVVNTWSKLAGLSPWTLRLPSVLFSVAAVAGTSALAARLAGLRAARWGAWLSAISPFLIHHAQEARMYPMVAALSVLSALLLLRYLQHASTRLGIGFVLVNIALLATHYYTAFLVAGELLVLMLLRPAPLRRWLPAALACVLATLALTYLALFLTRQASGEIYGIGVWALPGVVWSMLAGYPLLPSAEQLHAVGMKAIWPYLPFAIAGGAATAALFVAALVALRPLARLVVVVLLGCVLLGPFAVSKLFSQVSVHPRYFSTGAPLLFALLAAGMPALRAPRWQWASAVLLVAVMAGTMVFERLHPGYNREDVYAAGAWLDDNVPVEEEILVTSEEMMALASYHWPQRRLRLYPEDDRMTAVQGADAVARAIPFEGHDRRIYVFGRSWVSDRKQALEGRIRDCYRMCPGAEVRGIRIYCLLPGPANGSYEGSNAASACQQPASGSH